MTINDVIKLVVFVVTLCGYGYAQQLRMERMEAKLDLMSAQLVKQDARFDEQAKDIEAWKQASAGMFFKPRGK